MRWVQRRTQILHGQAPNPSNVAMLAQLDNALNTVRRKIQTGTGAVLTTRQDLTAATDQRVFNELNARDTAAGNWTAEMPGLATLRSYIQSQ